MLIFNVYYLIIVCFKILTDDSIMVRPGLASGLDSRQTFGHR